MKKVLVAYFSASGVTAQAAETIAETIGADLYEIRPETPYTPADLDWMNRSSRSSVEMNNRAFRPKLADLDAPVAAHDTIFLGFPIWWGVAPTIVNTFLEAYDFSGKTMIPFATSGGSDIRKAEKSLKEHCPAASWERGKLLNGSGAGDWAKSVV